MRAIVLLLLCHGLLAQSQPSADPATLARVEGRVLNSTTGEPLRKTQLTLHGPLDYTATSDASGHFAFEGVAPGSYNLTAEHQNFAVLDYGAPRPGMRGKSITLAAAQSVTDLEMKLVPFGVISGKVVDQDGDPVSGVPVMVMHWGFIRGGRQLTPVGAGTSTNDRGEYRIYNLSSGRYFVVARPAHSGYSYIVSPGPGPGKRGLTRAESAKESFAITFYPSVIDASAASPVVVNAGQEVPGTDVQLRKTHTYTVQGTVSSAQKGRRYSLSLQALSSTSGGDFGLGRAVASVRPEDGTFVFGGVAPGRYTLISSADNRVSSKQEISVGEGDLEGLVVTLAEAGSIKGRVQIEPSGAQLPSLKGLRVFLAPVDGIQMNTPNASTAEDGSFAIDDVSADRYKVNCSPLEGAYLKTIRWSGQVANDGIVDMSGGGAATLELVFAPTTAQIEGDVKTDDDQPLPGAPVLLAPASGHESDFRTMMADSKGHFSAKGVAPGSYTALSTDAQIFSMPDAALLKALEKLTTSVNVDENGHATVLLKLVPEAVIEAVQ